MFVFGTEYFFHCLFITVVKKDRIYSMLGCANNFLFHYLPVCWQWMKVHSFTISFILNKYYKVLTIDIWGVHVVKVQIFWESHKNFTNLLTFTKSMSKPWGRLWKFLWPSQKSWTLKKKYEQCSREWVKLTNDKVLSLYCHINEKKTQTEILINFK